MVVFWTGEFDNSRRHCWPYTDGVNRLDGDWDTVCNGNHNPTLTGQVEWMRFIREVNKIIRQEYNDVRSDNTDLSEIHGFGAPTKLEMHIERYPDWTVYFDGVEEATIELHNEDLIWIAEEAYNEVQASYER